MQERMVELMLILREAPTAAPTVEVMVGAVRVAVEASAVRALLRNQPSASSLRHFAPLLPRLLPPLLPHPLLRTYPTPFVPPAPPPPQLLELALQLFVWALFVALLSSPL